MATMEYTVVVQNGEKERLKERLRIDQTLNARVKNIRSGESLLRINVDVNNFRQRKDVEDRIRGNKTDIVRSLRIAGSSSDVEEKRSIQIAKVCMRVVLSYVIIFTNIIATAVAGDYTKLTNGMFPWYIVFLVSIPSAVASVYSIDRTKPGN
jgi:hypothetical protein